MSDHRTPNEPPISSDGQAVKLTTEHAAPGARLPWPTSPEQVVLSTLLDESALFRAFYHAERASVSGDIVWARDQALPPGIDFRRTILPLNDHKTVVQVIRVRRIPAVLDDAIGIAHELQHLLLDQAGFPPVYALAQMETLAAALASMLQDPIVNARLSAHGFDLQPTYHAELRESRRQLAALPDAPTHPINQLHWIINYTAKLLDTDVMGQMAGGEGGAFLAWFDTRYPLVAQEAHMLHALITASGHAHPEQQRALFARIIRRYRLDGIIGLVEDASTLRRQCSLLSSTI